MSLLWYGPATEARISRLVDLRHQLLAVGEHLLGITSCRPAAPHSQANSVA